MQTVARVSSLVTHTTSSVGQLGGFLGKEGGKHLDIFECMLTAAARIVRRQDPYVRMCRVFLSSDRILSLLI